jgi:hypothetical protein
VANLILLFPKIGENGTCPSWAVAFLQKLLLQVMTSEVPRSRCG